MLDRIVIKKIFTIHQLVDSNIELEKDIKKYKSESVVITITFSFQIHKVQKKINTGYISMIKAITKIKDSIILVFSPRKLQGLMNY